MEAKIMQLDYKRGFASFMSLRISYSTRCIERKGYDVQPLKDEKSKTNYLNNFIFDDISHNNVYMKNKRINYC